MTQDFLAARRATLVDCVARRNELRAAELAEREGLQDVASEMYEATQAIEGEGAE